MLGSVKEVVSVERGKRGVFWRRRGSGDGSEVSCERGGRVRMMC